MACLWVLGIVAMVIAIPSTAADVGCSPNCSPAPNLNVIVAQLNQCSCSVNHILGVLGPKIVGIAANTIAYIDADRDRTLDTIAQLYETAGVAGDIRTLAVQASQIAAQFGDRKRSDSAVGIGQVKDEVDKAFAAIATACGATNSNLLAAVLQNTAGRVGRKLSYAVEWIRDYSETNIFSFLRAVYDSSKWALVLNDRALTTQHCQQQGLQQELDNVVAQMRAEIVQTFNENDDKLIKEVKKFVQYFVVNEYPLQAVQDYINDN